MMRMLVATVGFAVMLSGGASAANESGKSPSTPAESNDTEKAERAPVESTPAESARPDRPVYRPPARGKPRARIGGGVRGVDRMWPSLFALVPDHSGRTVAAQPSLFWYIDTLPVPDVQIVFTLMEEDGVQPMIEARIPRPERSGIQRIDLAPLGTRLEADHAYEWSVALVDDPGQRAHDVVTVGWIDRVEPPAGLASPASAAAYAEHGLWYDALAAAADGLRDAPGNSEARSVRDELLLQVGLGAAVPAP